MKGSQNNKIAERCTDVGNAHLNGFALEMDGGSKLSATWVAMRPLLSEEVLLLVEGLTTAQLR